MIDNKKWEEFRLFKTAQDIRLKDIVQLISKDFNDISLQNLAKKENVKLFNIENIRRSIRIGVIKWVILYFIKKHYYIDVETRIIIKYKIWRKKMYIISMYNAPPTHPNCSCSYTNEVNK